MPDGGKVDLKKLQDLIIANTGQGKRFTRRGLSMRASNGRNPDLVRDIMRVGSRPTIETAAGICAALDHDLSDILKGFSPTTEVDHWLTITRSVQAGVWREQPEWARDDMYQLKVGPPAAEGQRFGAIIDGRSMDKTILPGMILECVDIMGSDIVPANGSLVIVERRQGDLRETTVKRLNQREDGNYELIAESTLPEFKDPIFVGKPDFSAGEDRETRIVALVVRGHLNLPTLERRPLPESA